MSLYRKSYRNVSDENSPEWDSPTTDNENTDNEGNGGSKFGNWWTNNAAWVKDITGFGINTLNQARNQPGMPGYRPPVTTNTGNNGLLIGGLVLAAVIIGAVIIVKNK